MPLPPLNRLRKGVVFLFFLFFTFILYRIFIFKTAVDASLVEDAHNSYTEINLLISSGKVMNVDTVFNLKNGITKIFSYSFLDPDIIASDSSASDTVKHIWYYGSDKIKEIACTVENNSCLSSISADSLQEGDWSIDTRRGETLISIKQFRVENR